MGRSTMAKAMSVAVLVGVALPPAWTSVAQTPSKLPPAFSATASSLGIRARLVVPGFVATDVPVDSGGPTAQAALDSLNQSQAYAALPDPGQFVVGLPGLAAGLFSGGAGGLPPINAPFPVPAYPLSVSTQYPAVTHQEAGDGPYRIEADSRSAASSARASGGIQLSATGNTGLVVSDAEITSADATVTSTAMTDIQAVTVGPLTIGRVRAVAEVVLGSDGEVTPHSDLGVENVRIGGVAVQLTSQGLDAAGAPVPLPVAEPLNALLVRAGIRVDVLPPPETADGTVVSGALRVTVSNISIPNVGAGTLTLTLGSASASIRSLVLTDPVAGEVGPSDAATGLSAAPAASVQGELVTATPVVTAPGRSAPAETAVEDATAIASQPDFDLTLPYVVLAAAAFMVLLLGQLTRLLGVRAPWKT